MKNEIIKIKKDKFTRIGVIVVFAFSLFTFHFSLFTSIAHAAASADSTFTTSLTVAAPDSIPPSTPTNLAATAISQSEIDLSWSPSTDNELVLGYVVYRDTIAVATTSNTYFDDALLTASTTYDYNVQAFDNSYNYSSSTPDVATTTLPVPPVPPAPTSTPAVAGLGGGLGSSLIYDVHVTADSGNAIISFKTELSSQSTVVWGLTSDYEAGSVTSVISDTSHQVTLTDLNPDTHYYVSISATATNGSQSSFNTDFNTSGLPGTALPNPSDFFAVPGAGAIDLSWTNTTDPRGTKVRIVRSETFFPSDQFDGTPLYEGPGSAFRDGSAVVGKTYYYAIFSEGANGLFSSGALATSRIPFPGQAVSFASSSNPFAGITFASNVNPMISGLTLADFQFIQEGKQLAVSGSGSIHVNGQENLTIRLPYNKVPQILKTIAVTLNDPTDPSKAFIFLLRANADDTYYEASIGPLGRTGTFPLTVTILDYQNQGLKQLSGNLSALSIGAYSAANGADLTWFWIGLICLILILILISLMKRNSKKRRDPKITVVTVSVIAFFFIHLALSTANAAWNPEINYQGKLANASNVTVADGSYNMEFKLYTTATGATTSAIWTEDDLVTNGQGVPTKSGLFSIMLGSTTPLTGINFNQTLYLGVTIGATSTSPAWDGEMSPRKIIGAVPAAFYAGTSTYAVNAGTSSIALSANTLQNITPGQFVRNDQQNATSSTTTFISILQSGAGKIAEFFGAASQSVLALLSNGNVGIGSSTPSATLTVEGTSSAATTNLLTIASSTGASLLNVLANGNVGIGSSTPSTALVVNGTTTVGSLIATTTATSTFAGGITANCFSTGSGCLTSGTNFFSNSGATTTLSTGTSLVAGLLAAPYFMATSSTATSTFAGALSVAATTTLATSLNGFLQATNGVVSATTSPSISALSGVLAVSNGGTGTSTAPGLNQLLIGNGSGGYNYISTTSLGVNYFSNSGATTTLSTGTNLVAGLFAAPYFVATSSTATSTFNGGALFALGGGMVGIGTTSPTALLTVQGSLVTPYTSSLFAVASSSNATSSVIFNITGNGDVNINPAGVPTFAGATTTGLSSPQSVYVSGKYAYVAGEGNNSLVTFDISNPAAPTKVASTTISSPISVYVSGRYAYVASYTSSSLVIVDISDPASPVQVGSSSAGLSSPISVSVSGHYAYVVSYGNNSLVTFDISNPAAPTKVGSVAVATGSGNPLSVYVSGRYAYVTRYYYHTGIYSNGSLVTFDISNPTSPVQVGLTSTGLTGPYSVYVSGRYAYVVNQGGNALVTFDVSNPASPAQVASTNVGLSSPYSIFASGRYAYVTSYANSSLVTFDISNPASPVEVASTNAGLNNPFSAYVAGRYAYVASLSNNSLVDFDLGGAEFNTENVGSSQIGNLQVSNDIIAQGQLQVGGGLNVGSGGIFSSGPLSVSVASSTQANAISAYFQGLVGIGTTSPTSNFSIQGTSSAPTTNLLTVASSSGAIAFTILANGNVGIGTSSPSNALEVAGNGYFAGNLTATNITATGTLAVTSTTTTGILAVTATTTLATSLNGFLQATNGVVSATTSPSISALSGVLAVSNGGTGTSTAPGLNQLLIGNGSGGYNYISTTSLGVNYFSNSGATTTLSTGTILAATTGMFGTVNATSTTGTSTFAGNLTMGPYAFASNNSFAGGFGAVFGGSNIASGAGSLAFGDAGLSGGGITASSLGSIALGAGNLTASGEGSIAVGWGDNHFGGPIVSSGSGSFAGGYSTTDLIQSSGAGSFAFGDNVIASNTLSTAFGTGFTNNTADSFMVGYGAMPTLTVNSTSVGIGTTSPVNALTVAGGNAFISGNLTATNITATGTLAVTSTTTTGTLAVTGTSTLANVIPAGPYTGNMSTFSLGASTTRWSSVWAQTVNIGTSTWSLAQTGTRFGIFNQAQAGGSEALSILPNGNVGIGTTSPVNALTVAGNGFFNGNLTATNITATGTLAVTSTTTTGGLSVGSLSGLLFGTSGAVSTIATSSLGLLGSSTISALTTNYVSKWNGSAFVNSLIYDNGTNVGIGTTSPSATLSVQGQLSTPYTNSLFNVASSSNTSIFNITGNGDVNILPAGVPVLASSTNTGLSAPYSIYISGKYAYVASAGNNSLVIFDISNPTSPTELVATNAGLSAPKSVYVSGRYAYVASNGNGALVIFDISNPTVPTKIASVNGLGGPNSVYVSGRYAYVASNGGIGLVIIDISNPFSPIEVSSTNAGLNAPQSVYVSGRYAYVASQTNSSLVIFDISNPVSPTQVGSTTAGLSFTSSVSVSGRYAYVSDFSTGLIIFDISNPTLPTEVGSSNTGLNNTASVYVSGKYAYMTSENNNSFVTFDISSSTSPVKVASTNIGLSTPISVYVSGRYAYVASHGNNSLVTFDLGGGEFNTANVGSLQAGNLQVSNDIIAQGQLQVGGGLNVGSGGIFSSGPLSVSVASSTQANAISAYFQGLVGIGTTTPSNPLEVLGNSYFAGNITATGTLAVLGSATSTFAGTISSTCFYYSGSCLTSAISYFSNSGATTTLTTGSIFAASTGAFGSINATSTTATSTFAGAISANNASFGGGNAMINSDGSLNLFGGQVNLHQYYGNTFFDLLSTNTGAGSALNLQGQGGRYWELQGGSTGSGSKGLTLYNWGNGGNIYTGGIPFKVFDNGNVRMGALTQSGGNPGANAADQGDATQFVGSTTVYKSSDGTTVNFRVLDTGKVGIGTSTPTNAFEVNGNGYFAGSLTAGNITATGTLSIFGTASSTFAGSINSTSGNLVLQSNGLSNSILLNAFGGSVGIGTSSPSAILSVQGALTTPGTNSLFNVASSSNATSSTIFSITGNGDVNILPASIPTYAGATTTGLSTPQSVYVSGKYAYVASLTNGSLVTFDISNPAMPTQISTTNTGLTGPWSVFVSGRYAYVVSNPNSSLVIFDVSNPATPTKVGSTNVGLNHPVSVYVSGHYAYVASALNSAFVIFDVSNPATPTKVGSTNVGLNTPYSVYVSGPYAYVASSGNNSLVIFDISNPAAPTELAATTTALNTPQSIYVSGRYAYVADGTNGLIVFDISNPAAPTKVASTNTGLSGSQSVYISGRYAYVASNTNNSLVTFDISNPASPNKVSSTNAGLSGPWSVFVSGHYAYVASANNNSLVTFDLGGGEFNTENVGSSQIGNLQVSNDIISQGQLQVGGGLNVGAGGIFSSGPLSVSVASSTQANAISAYFQGLVGIGTTTPSNPLEVLGNSYFAGNITATGTLAVLGSATSTFAGVVTATCFYVGSSCLSSSASYFSNLGATTTLTTGNIFAATTGTFGAINATSTTATSTFAGVLTVAGSLGVGSTSPLAPLSVQGTAGTSVGSPLFAVASSSGSTVFTIAGNGDVNIVPAGVPTFASATTSGLSVPASVYVSGKYAYVADNSTGLVIFDMTNPALPTKISTLSAGLSGPQSIYVSGRYAYVITNGNNSVAIVDVSNPFVPVKISSLNAGLSSPYSVYVSGHYAYVASAGNSNLVIFDVSNPASPIKVGSTNVGLSSPDSVYVAGRYAYVANANGLTTFDVSNPAVPTETGSTNIGLSTPISVYVSGRYAYVASNGNNSLVTFDISNPALPKQVGTSNTGLNQPISVYVSGRYAYVASYNNAALVTFDVSNPVYPVEVSSTNSNLVNPYAVFAAGRYAYVADQGNSSLVTFDLGGGEFNTANVGSLQAGNLQVTNDIIAQGQLQVGGGLNVGAGGIFSSGPLSVSVASSTQANAISAYFQGLVGIGTTSPTSTFSIQGTSSAATTNLLTVASSSGASLFIILANGNIGIGTSTPSNPLEVNGNGYFAGNLTAANITATGTLTVSGAASSTFAGSINSNSGNLVLQSNGTGNNILLNAYGGKIGIGTSTLSNAFEVNGNGYFAGSFKAGNITATGTLSALLATATSTLSGGLTVGNNAAFVVNQLATANSLFVAGNGNVGFGTSTPTNKFEVLGNGYFAGNLTAANITATGTLTVSGAASSTFAGSINSNSGNLVFQSNGTTNKVLINAYGGYVNIGTTTGVLSTVTISGSVCVATTTTGVAKTACGSQSGAIYDDHTFSSNYDVAEEYQTSDPTIGPGDIVAVDSNANKNIKRAAAGARILGIVSSDPGLLLGGADSAILTATYQPVALSGRVPTKVDTEGGPISIGDSIALSSTPGVGMKATSTAEVVGIALEPYDSAGVGDIDVFVNLRQNIDLGEFASASSTNAQADSMSEEISASLAAIQSLQSQSSSLSLEFAALASSTLDLASTTAALASTTASDLATSTSFIQTIASAVVNLLQSSGQLIQSTASWTVAEIHASLGVFARVETKTAAVTDGLEMTDSATGQIYCVRITNGNFDKTLGACSDSATSTPAEGAATMVQTPFIGGAAATVTTTETTATVAASTSTIVTTVTSTAVSTVATSSAPSTPATIAASTTAAIAPATGTTGTAAASTTVASAAPVVTSPSNTSTTAASPTTSTSPDTTATGSSNTTSSSQATGTINTATVTNAAANASTPAPVSSASTDVTAVAPAVSSDAATP